MKIYIETNKATTNIFGFHTQPRKTTRYTNILKLACCGGGGRKKNHAGISKLSFQYTETIPHNYATEDDNHKNNNCDKR